MPVPTLVGDHSSIPKLVIKSEEDHFVLAEVYSPSLAIKQLYWIAGFLEGEGCFYWDHSAFCISANQVQVSVLKKLRGLVGGTFNIRRFTDGRNQIGVWKLTGRAAVALSMTLYCLLSERRMEQIKKGLDVWRKSISMTDINRAKTHCPDGHPYNDQNTVLTRTGKGYVTRTCKTCLRLRNREYRSLDYWKNW